MKKIILVIVVIIVIILAVAVGVLLTMKPQNNPNIIQPEEEIVISSPKPNQLVETPLVLEGKARGNWFFEASFPIQLLDADNNILATSHVQATSDWMTEDFVPFKGEISFISRSDGKGTLVFKKDNPSGLPQYDKEFRMPVLLKKTEIIKVKAYFNNSNLDPEFSCNKVFMVEREVAKTQATAKAALEELLAGPTEEEKSEGFFTSINTGVEIQSLTIQDGTAKVDFSDQLEYQVGGSCRVSAIRAQITETLKQFSTVENVVISINGRTEDILQP
jgi:hypothetical protein